MGKTNFAFLRKKMIQDQLQSRGIKDPLVLEAFSHIPRELFVPDEQRAYTYEDRPLPIGWKQTISQPYIVALMTECLYLKTGQKVLEIGTGSGYQSGLLAYMGGCVYSVERIPQLIEHALEVLTSLNLKVHLKVSDGTLGWEEEAPFDKIIVTAAAPEVPEPLLAQLAVQGRLVIPLGNMFHQELTLVHKIAEMEYERKYLGACVFVPLIGKYAWHE